MTMTTIQSLGKRYQYCVELTYPGNIPPFRCTVYALDDDNAKNIAEFEGIARGWPHTPTSSTIEKVD